MTHVATLIVHPDYPWLDDPHVGRARALLPGAGAPDWLDPGIAVDIPFAPAGAVDARALAAAIRDDLSPMPLDVVVQQSAHRRKRLFLADMDSTMIGQECIDELAAFAGLKEHVAAITERAMRGEIAFEPALRERVALLKGLPADVVDTVIAERVTFTSGGRELVRTMRAHGAWTALVSGGFTLFTGPIAAAIGFDENRANRLIVEDGRFAGAVAEPILGKQAKLDALRELRDARSIDPRDTLAVGDGANDLAMLGEAGLGVAYRAKPAVAAAAHARIDHANLTALLYAQGYRRAQFVA
ncbi:MAG: phosphoserine phosphatase SerB [Methylobacteriaceae bacterium]|nr:phosphoserine phosphatase SerB [Methylobacteriaceae bacterium]